MSTDSSVVTQPSAESVPTQVVQHFIGGQSVEATSGRFGTVYHPSSGKAARRVGFASRADVDRRSVRPRPPSRHGRPRRRCAARASSTGSVS